MSPDPLVLPPPKIRRPRAKLALALTFPLPVRALWVTASPEEQARAQETGTALLEMWLGRLSRAEAAKQLGIPLIRLAQLSKQAASGLVAGLLKQPKPRAKAQKALQAAWGPDVKTLQKRVQQLEQETHVQQTLIQLLKAMPGHPSAMKGSEKTGKKKANSSLPATPPTPR